MTNYKIIIPARFNSSRFPGKPLSKICGKSMIQRVWEKCIQASSTDLVYVATDDKRIMDHCLERNIKAIMTSKNCLTGTDRLFEVAKKIKTDVYINVQGDEPLISPNDIKIMIDISKSNPKNIFNAMCPIKKEEDYRNPNVPKVVVRNDGRLLYISRAPIPMNKNFQFVNAMKQVCIYAFPHDKLMLYGNLNSKTKIESIEDIEILRFLELGFEVKMVEVSESSIAVDTPKDLNRVIAVIEG